MNIVEVKLRKELEELRAELASLRWGIVANAGRLSLDRCTRWGHVAEATGIGSLSAIELCKAAGFDPDEFVGGTDGTPF